MKSSPSAVLGWRDPQYLESIRLRPEPVRHGELTYGLVVAVDVEGFSARDTLQQVSVQDRLSHILNTAAHNADLDRAGWYRQPRGDGELAVAPLCADPSRVLAHYTQQLVFALDQPGGTAPPLRLRVAMHLGTMTMGEFGPAGDTPIVACRLLDAPVAKRVLAGTEASNLVLVVSDRLYDDVVTTRFHELVPSRFRPMRVTAKGKTYRGHICVGSPRGIETDAAASSAGVNGRAAPGR
jgi:hypothetical protein